jgi:hypothetical protein
MNTKTVIYQVSTNGAKVAKVQADSLAEALDALYKGLQMQQKIEKNFLSLSKSRPIFVQGMDASGKFMLVRNIVPANWSEAQALDAINFILAK